MTRPASRALLAAALALIVGAAFLRMTWAREREAQLSRAGALGAELAHRLEVEFQRLSAVSETLALSESGGDCEAMRSSFRRITEHFPSILGIRRQHGSETCEDRKSVV